MAVSPTGQQNKQTCVRLSWISPKEHLDFLFATEMVQPQNVVSPKRNLGRALRADSFQTTPIFEWDRTRPKTDLLRRQDGHVSNSNEWFLLGFLLPPKASPAARCFGVLVPGVVGRAALGFMWSAVMAPLTAPRKDEA